MVVRVPTATPMPGRRRLIIIVVVVLAALLLAFTALSGFFVDILWFREVRLSDVFWTVLRTKVFLGLALGLTFFVLLYSNLWIVRRITPRYPALTPDQEILERYRMQFEPYVRWLLPLLALVIAFLVGVGATTHWQTYLLWRNGAGLIVREPRTAVRPRSGLLRVQPPVAAVHAGMAVLLAGMGHAAHGGRPLRMGWDPTAGAGVRREGLATGQGAPVRAARPHHAHEGVGVLPGAVRSADLHAGRGGRRLLYRRERAAARPPDPGGHRDRVRDPVPGQHPAPRMGAPRHRRGSACPGLDHRGCGLSGVRPAVPRRSTGVPTGATVHRGQHRGDAASLRARRDHEHVPARR